jgi:hypothetical protein
MLSALEMPPVGGTSSPTRTAPEIGNDCVSRSAFSPSGRANSRRLLRPRMAQAGSGSVATLPAGTTPIRRSKAPFSMYTVTALARSFWTVTMFIVSPMTRVAGRRVGGCETACAPTQGASADDSTTALMTSSVRCRMGLVLSGGTWRGTRSGATIPRWGKWVPHRRRGKAVASCGFPHIGRRKEERGWT